jgi:hypothetical protein
VRCDTINNDLIAWEELQPATSVIQPADYPFTNGNNVQTPIAEPSPKASNAVADGLGGTKPQAILGDGLGGTKPQATPGDGLGAGSYLAPVLGFQIIGMGLALLAVRLM